MTVLPGEKHSPVPCNHGKNLTLVAALTPNGLQTPWLIEGAMDTATFAWYIVEQLAPTLRPVQVVVDNLSAHKAESIRQSLEVRGCSLLFLPPYSPDCTPIEQAFSKLKAITSADATSWFARAGYALLAQEK